MARGAAPRQGASRSRNGLALCVTALSVASATALTAFVAMSPSAQAQTLRMATPIVSGDLIVKFRDASEPGRQLAAVLAGQRTVASVAPLAVRLSDELELPLVLVQVTSGREALLALDRGALARSLLARAGRDASVLRAAMPSDRAAPGLPSSELVLRVELHPDPAGPAPDGVAASLADRLAVGGLLRPRP